MLFSLVICTPVADLCNLTIVLHVPIRHYSAVPCRVFCLGRTVLLCVAVWNWPTCCAVWVDMVAGIKKKTLIRSKCWHDLVDVHMSKQNHYGVYTSIFMNYGSKRETQNKSCECKLSLCVISFDFYSEENRANWLDCQSEYTFLHFHCFI